MCIVHTAYTSKKRMEATTNRNNAKLDAINQHVPYCTLGILIAGVLEPPEHTSGQLAGESQGTQGREATHSKRPVAAIMRGGIQNDSELALAICAYILL